MGLSGCIAGSQIAALMADKAARSPAQRKLSSQLIYAALWEAYRKEYQMSSGGPGSGTVEAGASTACSTTA